jgi:hypothetical protein
MPKLATICFSVALFLIPTAATGQDDAIQRGKKALETRTFSSAGWSLDAYDNAWKFWGKHITQKPDNYAQAFMDRYGLHPAPFDNGKYPMGIREGMGLVARGIANDCLVCHGGSIMGKSYIGLGNSTGDIQALVSEMARASGQSGKLPFTFSHVRGTSEAAGFAVFLMALRQPDLNFRLQRLPWKVKDDLCEDPPAWWLLKKKKTMYVTGSNDARSVRSIMQFMLGSTHGPETFAKEEATFRDIQAYLKSMTPPPYPFAIDETLARKGQAIFNKNCSTCHGTYGAEWTYPNKIVPLDVIGTDRNRIEGLSEDWAHYYNESWFAKEQRDDGGVGYKTVNNKGYQAPPLDGVWATAPYLHNASVPTVYHLLNSKSRPNVFTRSYRTDEAAYDREKLGWKVTPVTDEELAAMTAYEKRKVYDTRLPGRGNGGHTFGDDLSEEERLAVIEYLKSL